MRILLPAVLSGLTLLAPQAPRAQEAEAPAAVQPALPAITVSTVTVDRLRDRVIASGLIGAVELVQVQPLIEGQPIEALEADVGDRVEAGQVLATLSSSSLELQRSQAVASLAAARAAIAQAEAQIAEARANADEARRVNERTQALRAQGTQSQAAAETAAAAAASATARLAVANQALEAARAQLALNEAQLANVELQLNRTQVVAPVAGEIVERNAQLGAIASAAGDALFVVVRDNALEVRADVAEQDVLRVAAGQAATINVVGLPEPLTGTVRLVEPAIDEATRNGRARVSIDRPEAVRQGLFADVQILVAEAESPAVPVTALGSDAEGLFVMRVRDGLVERVAVTEGIRDGDRVGIARGLAAGDLVVTRAAAFVRPGDRINPVPDAAGTN